MFSLVMKAKGKKMLLYFIGMAILMIIIANVLWWFCTLPEYRTVDLFKENKWPQMSFVMVGFFSLFFIPVLYGMMKSEYEAEIRVRAFAETYKVGDQFWALRRRLTYNPSDPSTVFNDIFHFKVEEINFKKTYFELSEEYRSGWHPRRTGMSDFIIFDDKDGLLDWLYRIQADFTEKQNRLNSIIEGVTDND